MQEIWLLPLHGLLDKITEEIGLQDVIYSLRLGHKMSHIDGLVQERRNSSVLAMKLRLSCTNPLI